MDRNVSKSEPGTIGNKSILRKIEQYLGTHTGGRPREGIAHQGLIDIAVNIELNIQFAVDCIAYVRLHLDVDVSICSRIDFIDLALDGLIVGYTDIQPEIDFIFQGYRSSLRLPGHLHIVLDKSNFQRPVFCIHFSDLRIRHVERQVALGLVFKSGGEFAPRPCAG